MIAFIGGLRTPIGQDGNVGKGGICLFPQHSKITTKLQSNNNSQTPKI